MTDHREQIGSLVRAQLEADDELDLRDITKTECERQRELLAEGQS